MNNKHFPIKGTHFPIKGTHFPIKGTHFPIKGTHFPIKGTHLPDDFDCPLLSERTRYEKRNDISTENNHLTVEEIKLKYSPNTKEGKDAIRKLNRSFNRHSIIQQTHNLIENYHYYYCPITNTRVLCLLNEYFKKFGIDKTRFLELFPEYNYCFKYAPAIYIDNNKAKTKRVEKSQNKYTPLSVTINGIEIDAKMVEVGIRKRRLKPAPDILNNPIIDYNCFKCPISKKLVRTFGKSYFEMLKELGVSEDDFKFQYPNVKRHSMTPYNRGVSYTDHLNGFSDFKPSQDGSLTRKGQLAKFQREKLGNIANTRNEKLTGSELRELYISDRDPIMAHYKETLRTRYDNHEILKELSTYFNIPINELYDGEHYLEHPITGVYHKRITLSAITPLGISKQRYQELFPGIYGSSPLLVEGIEKTKEEKNSHAIGAEKRIVTMNRIDPTSNKSKQQESTKKMLNTKTTTYDQYGRNVYQIEGDKNIIKSLKTRNIEPIKCRFRRYELIVDYMTNLIRDYFRYQGYNLVPITINSMNNSVDYQLDHRYSIAQGFEDKISPLAIGHIRNIEPLTVKDNSLKKNDCSITLQELSLVTHYSVVEMHDHYDKIIDVIDQDIINNDYNVVMSVLERAGHDIAMKMKPYFEFSRVVKEAGNDIARENLFDALLDHYF